MFQSGFLSFYSQYKKQLLSFVCFCFCFCLFFIISERGINKYIFLSLFSIVCCNYVFKTFKKYYFSVFIHFIVYIVVGSLCILLSSSEYSFYLNSDFTIKQILIYLCSLSTGICFFSLFCSRVNFINVLFCSLCLFWLFQFAPNISLDNYFYESNLYAWSFGSFFIYYFGRKKKIFSILAFVFTLLEHKRTSSYGLFLVIPFMLWLMSAKKQKEISIFLSIVLLLAPFLYVLLCNGNFFRELFSCLGIKSSGRFDTTNAWNAVKPFYDISILYFGQGIGFVLSFLDYVKLPDFLNLHNDFLAAYIELGFWGFILWVYSFQIMIKFCNNYYDKNIIAVLICYMFLHFCFDNIYLYITFWIPFICIVLSIISESEK